MKNYARKIVASSCNSCKSCQSSAVANGARNARREGGLRGKEGVLKLTTTRYKVVTQRAS